MNSLYSQQFTVISEPFFQGKGKRETFFLSPFLPNLFTVEWRELQL
ncbi:hypothetical protein M595_3460 [Lyngbya aestuarii BL J]|uniref:Uncharacterized protein n=1 Tax=Lyngbya aestuarii BL J TaxID=1348334 RepID=U7QFB7_9CYAN|nr:hypothetical protein M595_3460 [Lyngbya aestuarii BL J]